MRWMAARAMVAAVLLVAPAAQADDSIVAVRDGTVVQDERGAARILFRTAPITLTADDLIQSAVLTIPYGGEAVARSVELRVCPVLDSWGGGGRWDVEIAAELYSRGRLDLHRGGGEARFDVTVALREIVENGLAADGFVVTGVRPSEGISAEDATRLGTLAGATLHVRSTRLPSGRPSAQWLSRHGG